MHKFIFLWVVLFPFTFSHAQVQLGLFGGMANYQGDLSARPYQAGKGAIGLTAAYRLTSRIDIRAGITYAKIAGADSLNKNDLRLRNLSFQSALTEFSIVGQFHTFNLDYRNWSPYIFAGLSVFHFNPYTYDQAGNKVYLKPLSTEGQGLAGYPDSREYSLTQLAIPFGGGIKFNLGEKFRIGAEIGLRKLFTDHLDDVSGNYADAGDLLTGRGQQAVDLSYRADESGGDPVYPSKGSQRGSPRYKDYYYFSGIHLVYLLSPGSGEGRNSSRKGGYGCPTVF